MAEAAGEPDASEGAAAESSAGPLSEADLDALVSAAGGRDCSRDSAAADSESDLEQVMTTGDQSAQNEIAEDEINALLNAADGAAETPPDSSVADEASAEENHEEVTVTDEDLLAVLGSQEQFLAQIDETDTKPDADTSSPVADVQEIDVAPAADTSDAEQSAFSAADHDFNGEEEAAVKAITEIKNIIEEDDLTKLTATVERARELIADVGAQVDAMADGDAHTAKDNPLLDLANSDDSASLTRCMSELDHELESLLDELARHGGQQRTSGRADHRHCF